MKKLAKHSAIYIFCVLLVASFALYGCSSETTEEATMTSSSNAAMPGIAADATYVQVQSIDGNTITAIIGTMSQPSGQTVGNAPQGQGDSSAAPQGTPEQPSTDAGTQPDGQKPDGQGGGMMGFTAGTETLVFTVGDSTVITKQSMNETADAALTDIAVGDILAITLSSDNVAETILIQSTGDAPADAAQGN